MSCNDDKVILAFVTDENYVMPTSVAITSLICNKSSDICYKIYILGHLLSQESVDLFLNFSQENITILVLNSNEIFDYKVQGNKHVSSAAFLKFKLPELIDEDKVLYLDSDVVIQSDLSSLFYTDLEDYYAGVVLDFRSMHHKLFMNYMDYQFNTYFNSGVMLLNLQKMREDGVVSKILEHKITHKTHFADQDSFNCILHPKVKYLDMVYNYQVLLMNGYSKDIIKSIYGSNCGVADALIVHYAWRYKPWEYKTPVLNLFKKYYNLSPFSKRKLFLKTRYSKIRFLWDYLRGKWS